VTDRELARITASLRESRERGLPFDRAWRKARRSLGPTPVGFVAARERAQLRAALTATRDAWRRAYVGEPPARPEVVAAILLDSLGDFDARADDLAVAA